MNKMITRKKYYYSNVNVAVNEMQTLAKNLLLPHWEVCNRVELFKLRYPLHKQEQNILNSTPDKIKKWKLGWVKRCDNIVQKAANTINDPGAGPFTKAFARYELDRIKLIYASISY